MLDPQDEEVTSPSHAADVALVQRSLEGDPGAESTLLERLACVERILKALNRRFGRPLSLTDFDDLVQDTLILIWGKRGDFEGRATIETWSYRFCYLGLLGRCRSLSRLAQKSAPIEAAHSEPAPPTTNPREQLIRVQQVEAQLAHLKPVEACVIKQKHFEQQTFLEISAVLELGLSTVKSHYYRGLKKLRGLLNSCTQERER